MPKIRKPTPFTTQMYLERQAHLFARYYAKNTKRGWVCSITRKEVYDMFLAQDFKCAVSGLPFVFEGLNCYSPSIDRINNDRGYTPTNCRIVLYSVNSLKSVGTDVDMVTIAKAIVARSEGSPTPETTPPATNAPPMCLWLS